jgi:hypothetical protein
VEATALLSTARSRSWCGFSPTETAEIGRNGRMQIVFYFYAGLQASRHIPYGVI